MILGVEIALALVGLLALFTGRMNITGKKLVYGVPARLLGLLALTPLPLALLAVLASGTGDPTTITLIEGGVVFTVVAVVFGIGAILAVPRPEPANRTGTRAMTAGHGTADPPAQTGE